ncbi:MAG: hypothetical protein QM817_41725 [Archangium sp.]
MTPRFALLLGLVASVALAQPIVVPWSTETTSIPSSQAGDPAIITTSGGFVIGTDTAQIGAYSYTPTGALQQVIGLGPLKSADSRGPLLFVATANSAIHAFIDLGDGGLGQVAPLSFSVLSAGFIALQDVHDGGFVLHVTRTATLQRFSVNIEDGGLIYAPLDQLNLPQVPAGITVDDRNGNVFITLPTMGVVLIEPLGNPQFVASIDAGQLGATIGGLTLLPLVDGGTWVLTTNPQAEVIVASEFNSSVPGLTVMGSAAIGAPDGGSVRARLPQHLASTLQPMPGFPKGMLAVQDTTLANYKLVSLEPLANLLQIPGVDFPPEPDSGVSDGGRTDGGVTDGGADGGADGGGTTGPGGGGTGPGGGRMDPPTGCSCGNPLLVFLPALLLLWWIRRPRNTAAA